MLCNFGFGIVDLERDQGSGEIDMEKARKINDCRRHCYKCKENTWQEYYEGKESYHKCKECKHIYYIKDWKKE